MLTNLLPLFTNLYKRLAKRAQARLAALPSFGGVRTAAWIGAGLLLVALVYLAQSSNAALIARNLRAKQLKIAEIRRENAQLRFEIAAATAPSAIEKRAGSIGLKPPRNVVYADNLSALRVDLADVMPAFAPHPQHPTPEFAAPHVTVWQQLFGTFGFNGTSSRAEAQTK